MRYSTQVQPSYLVGITSKSFIVLVILALTSSVNAAPCMSRPHFTRRTLLTSDLGLRHGRENVVAERAAAPAAKVISFSDTHYCNTTVWEEQIGRAHV